MLPLPKRNASRLIARIRSAVTRPPRGGAPEQPGRSSALDLLEWARRHELSVRIESPFTTTFAGHVCAKPYRLEIGPPTRDYIVGQEVRVRCELGIDRNVTLVVMTRRLKAWLEESAYSQITDGDQTALDTALHEEMRWLAAFPEVGWAGLSMQFWEHFAILTPSRQNAHAWIDQAMADQLLALLKAGPATPLMLAVLRGKCYLRTQYPAPGSFGLDPVVAAFRAACEQSVLRFS